MSVAEDLRTRYSEVRSRLRNAKPKSVPIFVADEPEPVPEIIPEPIELPASIATEPDLSPTYPLPTEVGVKPKVSDIVRAACAYFNMSVFDLVSNGRTLPRVRARQAVTYLSRHLTTRSYPYIARHLGGRDHSTIVHSYARAKARMETDEHFAADVRALEAKILARL